MALNISHGNKIDYTYQRVNRRQSVLKPIILPALGGDLEANIAVVIDTSGSMSGKMIGQGIAEIMELLDTFRLPVQVIPCDAKAYAKLDIITTSDRFKMKELQGGGGTNMNKGIEAALDLRPRPDLILVLTDGYTPWPNTIPAIPTIFGIIHAQSREFPHPPMPPWTAEQVIGIEMDTTY